MSDKRSLYNTVFSLIEEELYHRKNPSGYKDNVYDGSSVSICGSSNLDISSLDNMTASPSSNVLLTGGGHSVNDKKYMPGKFDVIKNSYHLPLNLALKGTVERQLLFAQEHSRLSG